MKKAILLFLFSFVFTQIFSQNNVPLIYQRLQKTKISGIDDSLLTGTCTVFENHTTNKGRIIKLNIIVVPGIHRDSLLPPIFDIDGGPGFADTKNVFFYTDSSESSYRQYHDIVLVDVRGTGKSNSLYCPSLQDKKTLNDNFEDMYPSEAVKDCYQELSKHADLTQYTTTNVVLDFEEVRKWLGYNRIDLLSLSYGTRVAQVYLKMFPQSIAGCVLWSPIPASGRMPLYFAKYAQHTLEQIFTDCRNDSVCNTAFPNLKSEFNTLMQNGKASGFHFSLPDSTGTLKSYSLSWNVLETKFRELMYSPNGIRKLPMAIHQLYKGDFSIIPMLFPADISTFNQYYFSEGFYLCITCSEDVPYIKKDEIDSLTKGTFMGTYRIDQQKQACANWVRGNIPKDFFQYTVSDVPTLIIAGGFDPVTPVDLSKAIASRLKNSILVFIPQMSHMPDGLSNSECFDKLLIDFFSNPIKAKLNLDCIKEMKPPEYSIKQNK